MFTTVSNKVDFPAMEREVLGYWEAQDTFKKSLEQTRESPVFTFYDGPPFATGLPHYGHLLAGTIKDIVPRYQTMRGHYVERRFGWDTHGLPIEALAQEALGISGAHEIRELGVDKFNEQCRSMVLRYVDEWRKTVTRMGRWVDFDNDYKTMTPEFMESVWWVFKQLWEQNRVYRSYRIMPYSWKLNTPLSNFEAGNNYKDVQDPAVTVRVKVKSTSIDSNRLKSTEIDSSRWWLLLWTTTPWTLPGNLAVCAGPDIDYVAVKDGEDVYVLAKERMAAVFGKEAANIEIVSEFKGTDLLGWEYEPLFPYFAETKNCFRVLNDAFVTTGDGTGLVHMAPAYGEDDFRVCKENGITEIADPLDANCAFTDKVPEYAGMFCKDADKDIIRRMKGEGSLVHQSTIVHSYPFCDRTDTPLIYRAIEAWYVRIEDVRDRLVKNNEAIRWTPDYVGEKRFGNWLKEARDWNISRNRFWGSCLPVWINEKDPSDMICVGSIAELEALSGEKVTDLHKHFMDKIVIRLPDGRVYRRTPEVLDCWFESGAMPYAQHHYPFSPSAFQPLSLSSFPADFIAEGLDQTRGWFYTLLVLGTLLFDKSPYRNVVVNGLVLAEDGKKMSKRLKNYPDPMEVLDTCGADALRLYMIYSPVVRAENLRFSENGVKQILRDLLIPWWNAYAFFVTYANVDGWHEDDILTTNHTNQHEHEKNELKNKVRDGSCGSWLKNESDNELDRWIVSSLETLIADVTEAMDAYDLQKSVRPFVLFVDNLTNWYIRRSRRRFWKSQNDADKIHAYRTLRYVLVQLSKVAAPFTPFIAEAIYRNLRGTSMPESVHLCAFPTANAAARDAGLEHRMELAQTAVRLGHFLRKQKEMKVRQPLSRVTVVSADETVLKDLAPMTDVIADELNVKHVDFATREDHFVHLSGKANFKTLGAKLGKRMKAGAAAIATLSAESLSALLRGGDVPLALNDGEPDVTLSSEDVQIVRQEKLGQTVANEGNLTIALETTLTPELIAEGLARELVSKIQALRKDMDLEVTQRIAVTIQAPPEVIAAIETHRDTICTETLCTELVVSGQWSVVSDTTETDINGHPVRLAITPI
ncbi:MAG: isoleucine--tRNA ligase [Kiritimatiellaeota bacterium]|nr:isoleucine--tRNA ligase [Kiritimatiellota bacterium]